MASLLDISLLNQFSDIFVLLFIFTSVYAILQFKSPFGNVKGLNALLAFSIAIMFIFSQDLIAIVKDTIPWLVLLMVMLMVGTLATKSIGFPMSEGFVTNLGTYVMVLALVIFFINVSLRFGDSAGPYIGGGSGGVGNGTTIDPDNVIAGDDGDVATNSYAQNFGATLFHPKVLGLILVLCVALFSVLLIGYWI